MAAGTTMVLRTSIRRNGCAFRAQANLKCRRISCGHNADRKLRAMQTCQYTLDDKSIGGDAANEPSPHAAGFGSVPSHFSLRLTKSTTGIPGIQSVAARVPRLDKNWCFAATGEAGRYQSDKFFVVDTRLQYKVTEQGTINVGIDNIGNAKYHLFHPFPQRTFVLEGKLKL
jgi:outer membrane receptor for ferric coprogen and ferric-rhodotorulic acid